MSEERLEDVVVVFDVSRSMFRRDFAPSRLEAVKQAIEAFVARKLTLDNRDRVALVAFSSKGNVVSELTNEPDILRSSLRAIKASGSTGIGEGLAVAIQLLVKEIQALGQKIFRVILISDGKPWGSTIDPFKMTTLASRMKIYIDTVGIGELGVAYEDSVLEKIANTTKGEYSRVFEAQSLTEILTTLAKKKEISYSEAQKKTITDATILSIIAGDLFRPTEASEDQSELINLISGREKVKCIICYQYDCQTCHGPFFSCGRYCSNCKAPMHLHCAADWAENSPPEKNPTIFRCPRCFFLLKVPEGVQAVKKLHSKQYYSNLPTEAGTTRFALITKETDEIASAVCPICHIIFDFSEDPRAYLCTNCGTYYHAKCLEEWLAKGEGACRVCGKRIEM
ncbi:MAG: VWA domain-containing protein [Promethearchaeota archaeon]|nr:MAG: VWA domain-containing protein [Candidatus Lokiarchaeota archaeon]